MYVGGTYRLPIYRYQNEYVKRVNLKHYDVETDRRYRLDVVLKSGNPDKSVLLIMMNPSRASQAVSDNTINRVIKYVSLNNQQGALKGIGHVIFTNLYVVYETHPEKVNEFTSKHSWDFIKGIEDGGKYNNNTVIEEAKDEAQVIIIAWGEGDIRGYDKRIREVHGLLRGRTLHHVREMTSEGYPRHPRNWSYSWPLVEFKS